jgi:hypothetical protein
MERSSDIALDTSSEAADTIDYAATPAAGNTAPRPARNIDPVGGDATAALLASFFSHRSRVHPRSMPDEERARSDHRIPRDRHQPIAGLSAVAAVPPMMTARRVSCVMAFSLGVGGLLRVVVAAAVEMNRGMLPPSAAVENGPPWPTIARAISRCAATG